MTTKLLASPILNSSSLTTTTPISVYQEANEGTQFCAFELAFIVQFCIRYQFLEDLIITSWIRSSNIAFLARFWSTENPDLSETFSNFDSKARETHGIAWSIASHKPGINAHSISSIPLSIECIPFFIMLFPQFFLQPLHLVFRVLENESVEFYDSEIVGLDSKCSTFWCALLGKEVGFEIEQLPRNGVPC